MLVLFNGLLTNVFQPSLPTAVRNGTVVVDFHVVVANVITPPGTTAVVQWYPEYASADPNAAGTRWYRETTEESLGMGDVRMSQSIRRFTENGNEVDLPPGTYDQDVQLKREHAFVRYQIRVAVGSADACQAELVDPFGTQLQSAP